MGSHQPNSPRPALIGDGLPARVVSWWGILHLGSWLVGILAWIGPVVAWTLSLGSGAT